MGISYWVYFYGWENPQALDHFLGKAVAEGLARSFKRRIYCSQ